MIPGRTRNGRSGAFLEKQATPGTKQNSPSLLLTPSWFVKNYEALIFKVLVLSDSQLHIYFRLVSSPIKYIKKACPITYIRLCKSVVRMQVVFVVMGGQTEH